MSCIHFKFKSSLEYEKITFDGLHISLGDLKEAIMKQKKIGLSNQYTLRVVDAQSKKVYEGDSEMLPRNTSVIISRVPLVNAPKIPKTQHKDPTLLPQPDSSRAPTSSSSHDSKKLTAEELRKMADIANANATEEEKLKAVISQSGEGFDPSQYVKVPPGRSSGGGLPMGLMKPPPPSYVCFRCGQRGHWIKLCPTNGDPNYDNYRYKRSMGIPSSQIVPASESTPLAMQDRHGNLVVRQVDLNAFLQAKQAKAVDSKPKKELEIPPELICHICKKLVKDAVIIPCCGESFCYDCIQDYLCENEFTCPMCKKSNVSPDNLAPNKALRTAAKNFTMKASEEKSVAMARGFVPVVPQVTPQQAVLASKRLNSIGPATVTPATVSTNTSNSLSIASTTAAALSNPSTTTTTAVSSDNAAQSSSSKNNAVSVADGSKSVDSAVPSEDSPAPLDGEKDGLPSEKASVSGTSSDQKTSKEETDESSKETGAHLSLPSVGRKRSRSRSRSPSIRPPKKRSTSPMPSGGTADRKTSGSERAREYLEKIAQTVVTSNAQAIAAPIMLPGKSNLLSQPLRPPLSNASILGLPHPMPAIPGLPHLPVIQPNLVNSLPVVNATKTSSKVPASTEQSSSEISKLERIAAELLLSSATAVSKKSTSPPPLTAEEFYRQQKLLKQITKKQKRRLSESSGSFSRSSVSYSRSATPDSTFSSDDSRSRSLTPSRSVSRNSSYSSSSRSRSRSPHYSSLKSHHRHRSKQHRGHRRHRHEREREKRERTSTKNRHRHKTKRHESSIQPKTKAVKRSRKHRSRSRSPQLRKKHRVGDSLLSPEFSTAATTPEMADPEAQLMMKPHRHKHKKKEKRKHRHRRREVEIEDSLDDIADQPAVNDITENEGDVMLESGSIANAQPESESMITTQSGEVDTDKVETVETMTAESASITKDDEHHTTQEDKPEGLPDETTGLTNTAEDTVAMVDLVSYQDSSTTEAEHPSDAVSAEDNVLTKEEHHPSRPLTEAKEDDNTSLDEGDESMMISVHVDDAIDECSADLLDSECTQPDVNPLGKEEGELSDSDNDESTELENDLLREKEKTPPESRLSESLKARLGDLPTDNTHIELEEDEVGVGEEIIELMTKDLNSVLKNIPKMANNNKNVSKEKLVNKKHAKSQSVVSVLHPLAQCGSDLEDTTSELSAEQDTSNDSGSEEETEVLIPVKSSKSKSLKHSGISKKHKRKHSSSSLAKLREKEHKHERKRKRSKEQKSMKVYKTAKKSKSSREREKLREKEREREKVKKRKKHKKH